MMWPVVNAHGSATLEQKEMTAQMSEDILFIMREVGKLGDFGGALQTVLGFLFWMSTEHPEIFTEYLERNK